MKTMYAIFSTLLQPNCDYKPNEEYELRRTVKLAAERKFVIIAKIYYVLKKKLKMHPLPFLCPRVINMKYFSESLSFIHLKAHLFTHLLRYKLRYKFVVLPAN